MKEIFIFGTGASHASAETPLGQNLVWVYLPNCFGFDINSNRKKFGSLLEFFKSKKSATALARGVSIFHEIFGLRSL